MGYWNRFPTYVPMAERWAKALRQTEKLKKKFAGLEPVVVAGRTIASSWWGKSWNKNLERYADYSNRIGRDARMCATAWSLTLRSKREPYRQSWPGLTASRIRSVYGLKHCLQPHGDCWWKMLPDGLGRCRSFLPDNFPKNSRSFFSRRLKDFSQSPPNIV